MITLKTLALAYAALLRTDPEASGDAAAALEEYMSNMPTPERSRLPEPTIYLLHASLEYNDDTDESASWAERAVRDL